MKTFGDQQIINAIENKKLKQVVKSLLALRLNYAVIERIVRSKRELNNNEKKFVLSIINHNLHNTRVPKKVPAKVNKLTTKTSRKKMATSNSSLVDEKPHVNKIKTRIQHQHFIKPRLQVTSPVIIKKHTKSVSFAKRDIYNEIKDKVTNLRNAVNTYQRDGRTVARWVNPYFNHTFPEHNQLLNINKTH